MPLRICTGEIAQCVGGQLSILFCQIPIAPEIQWDSRSASKSKTGWADNSVSGVWGFGSWNRKRYLRFTASGTLRRETTPPDFIERTYTGASILDEETGIVTNTHEQCILDDSGGCSSPPGCCGPVSFVLGNSPGDEALARRRPGGGFGSGYEATVSHESLTSSVIGPPTASGGGTTTGENRFTVSDEYTTDVLKDAVRLALPAFDDDWNDTQGSASSLSIDEQSYSEREGKWRVSVPPDFVMGRLYRLYYSPRFTPTSGSPVLGEETYLSFTYAGQTHIAGSTEAIPEINGINDIANVYWATPSE